MGADIGFGVVVARVEIYTDIPWSYIGILEKKTETTI